LLTTNSKWTARGSKPGSSCGKRRLTAWATARPFVVFGTGQRK
jgi:hypothetical protein